MMKRMSFSETIFLFFLALIIFGPKKLPEIARQVGKFMNEFRRASNEFKAQIEQEIAHLEVESKPTILPPTPPVEGTTSRTLNAVNVVDAESRPVEAPATLADSTEAGSTDEPSAVACDAANEQSQGATEAVHPAEEVTSSSATSSVPSQSSQESHA
jgi:TatA/E family protein of Tat protein translocase